MDGAELERFIDDAKSLTKERNAEAADEFGLGHHARYHLDLEALSLTFFDADDAPAVIARIIPAGSFASASQSWLWAWENDSIPRKASEEMQAVRRFGEEHEIAALERTFSACDESLAWAVAAISLKLLNAQAVYRLHLENSQLFVLLFDVERTK